VFWRERERMGDKVFQSRLSGIGRSTVDREVRETGKTTGRAHYRRGLKTTSRPKFAVICFTVHSSTGKHWMGGRGKN
jgi:hypothetical protein